MKPSDIQVLEYLGLNVGYVYQIDMALNFWLSQRTGNEYTNLAFSNSLDAMALITENMTVEEREKMYVKVAGINGKYGENELLGVLMMVSSPLLLAVAAIKSLKLENHLHGLKL